MKAHDVPQTSDFRAGMAYAAHMLRHCIGAAHGANDVDLSRVEPNACCQSAVLVFALGIAEGLEDGAGGQVFEHEHT